MWSHSHDPGRDDRLVVVLHTEGIPGRTLQSVTYNGIAMTRLAQAQIGDTFPRQVEVWELKQSQLPATAGEYMVEVLYSGWVRGGGGSYTLSGTDQSAAVVVETKAQLISAGTDISIPLGLPEPGMLLIAATTAANAGTYTGPGGWTETWDLPGPPNGASFYLQGAGEGPLDVTASLDGNARPQVMAVVGFASGAE